VVDAGLTTAAVDLSWIPLGAGATSVRINGIVYEAVLAATQGRERRALYHSVLALTLPHGRYMVEMTPVPDRDGAARGVVAEGAVGVRAAGRFRVFRYEVRRWRNGIVPDLGYATEPPTRVIDDPEPAQAVFDLLPLVPTAVWGRDELRAGDMWSCNSVIAWALTMAGVDIDAVALPRHGRAPGWDAGITVARRATAHLCSPLPS
jgi:hypothetical protein